MIKISLPVLIGASFLIGNPLIHSVAYANLPVKGFIGAIEAGDYNFTSYDQGKLKENYLDKFREGQTEQKKYVERTVNEINLMFGMFLEETIYGDFGMQKMYDDSVKGSKIIDFETEYLATGRSFKKAVASIKNKIGSLTAVPGALQASTDVAAEEVGIVKLPGLLEGIDFSDIIAHYESQILAFEEYFEKGRYKVRSTIGDAVAEGLNWAPPITINADEIAKKKREILGKRALHSDPSYTRDLGSFVSFAKKEVNAFVDTYGTTERWRVQTAEQIRNREESLKMIQEHFWMRSYLRDTFGVQMGTFKLNYKKSIANIDILTTDTADLLSFDSNTVWETKDMIRLKQNMMNLLNRARERSQDIFGEGVDTFDRIASAVTFFKGKAPLAKVNAWMLELIANDVNEELMLANGDYMGLRAHYTQRYMSSAEREDYVFELMDKWDPEAGSEYDTGALSSVGAAFQVAKDAMVVKEAKIYEADQMQAFLDAVTANNTRSQSRERRRRRRSN